jgi:hypothetical protein
MGPFPFVQFGQAEINGNFGNEYAYRKARLTTLYGQLVTNLVTGTKLFIQINVIKGYLVGYNDAPFFSNLELDLPTPYITGVGIESYTLYVRVKQNSECFAAFTFDVNNGIVTAIADSFTGPDQFESAINRPYINEELKIAKTLSVYQQNGAAIFPDTFTFNSTTGIAERRLLRAYDWSYNEANNQPQRDAISDLRVIPKTVFQLRELSQIEKAMVSFFLEKPIKESIGNDDWNDTNIYLTPLPDDWEFDFITVSSSKKQLSISSSQYGTSFVLAGIKVSGSWYFQRFINLTYTSGTPPDLATGLSGSNPSNPDTGKLYSTVFYDYDQCEFGRIEIEEPFNLTIKSGDSYQINIPSNFIFEPEIGPTDDQFLKIGIFDCNGQYLQEIGLLTSPYNKILQWNIAFDSVSGSYIDIATLIALIDTTISDIALKSGNEQFIGIEALITIPNASLDLTGSGTDFANSISTYLSANNFLTTWDTIVVEGITIVQFITNVPSTFENGIIATTSDNTPISYAVFGVTANQYHASITIPPLANNNYLIGIFQSYGIEGDNYSSLLAISQPLQLDNFEAFTQILEYGATENSVIEGFEYINGWLQKIRVPLNGAGQTANSEESIYRNSDGTFQKPENSTDEVIYLHTDYLDLQTQRAMISATKNPIFVLEGQNLSVQGDLEITNSQDFTQNTSYRKLQQMKFQALTQGYQPENNSCIG